MRIRNEVKAERVANAFALRKRGKTYRQIGEMLGYSHEQARQDIQTMLAGIIAETKESAQEVLALELARLDDLQVNVYIEAQQGDDKAIGAVLKIMERRAKLLGLDVSRSLNVTVTADEISKMSDEELHDLITTVSKSAGTS